MKPTIQPLNRQALSVLPRGGGVSVRPPQELATVPTPISQPRTVWGLKRQTRFYRGLTEMTNAHSGYLLALAERSKSFVAAARAAHEVAELPEICENDTDVRRLRRERDLIDARREVEEAKYGLVATTSELDKLRRPLLKKAASSNTAAIDALMRHKVDLEALGEDTAELDETLATLQRS